MLVLKGFKAGFQLTNFKSFILHNMVLRLNKLFEVLQCKQFYTIKRQSPTKTLSTIQIP